MASLRVLAIAFRMKMEEISAKYFPDRPKYKLYPHQQRILDEMTHSMDHIQPLVFNSGDLSKTSMTTQWPVGAGKSGWRPDMRLHTYYIQLTSSYGEKEFCFEYAKLPAEALPVRLMRSCNTVIDLTTKQVIKSIVDIFEYAEPPQLPMSTLAEIEMDIGINLTDLRRDNKQSIRSNLETPVRVISENQRKAILEIDPTATFSEDGGTVHSRIIYDVLCDIFNNID